MIVLGLSGLPESQAYHLETNPDLPDIDERICQGLDSAACLILGGTIVAAVAEERFTGEKATGAFPSHAIEFCLDHAGVGRGDVDAIAHGFNYDGYRRYFRSDPVMFDRALSGQTVLDALASTGWSDVADRFHQIEHHLAHAASAYHISEFENALSIVSDGMGEIDALTVHRISGGQFERVHHQGIETSLGILYSIVTRYLGYVFNSDEFKVMGLSAYGDPTRFASFFESLMACDGGTIHVRWPVASLAAPTLGYPGAMEFLEHGLGVPRRAYKADVLDDHADVAAAFQQRFTQILTGFARFWLRETGERNLCLSGGTFLNCLANQSIGSLPEVSQLFIPPAAGDDGTSMGAALSLSGPTTTQFTPFTGPEYDRPTIDAALQRSRHRGGDAAGRSLRWTYLGLDDDYFDRAARELANDRILAWFAGRMEFGPRALGNRSILALPSGASIKDRLNLIVKQRESFRPFAPAILESDYDEIFETPALEPAKYMLCTARVRADKRNAIAGAVHVDGTARVQIVTEAGNPTFWRLLQRVKHHTGLGCVINTSLNVKNQPIIMGPGGAIDGLVAMALDRLYIEGFVVSHEERSTQTQGVPIS